ncbi:sodium/glucose cotransporter 4-like [Ylistrum balloti]|uniref:sodium/glucose cotransporter 4-like n=1 Tax=Ylistrum balloti TaxID=509963 RepID=UPI002905D71E|nr:sodium/glucose cotransporter 4-like [Ylistrum balloti]
MEKGLNHWVDILIVVVYFFIVIGVGLWSLRRPKRGDVKSYFLAGRSMPWFAVGASLFSSNIGSEHFVGLAGAGASSGIAMVLYEWFVIFLILLCGWLFLPVYISAGVYTLPEYIEKRHGGRKLRTYLCCIGLILYIVTKLAVSIFAGSMFIQMTLGWDMYLSIIVLLVITSIYTILGGLTAVMYTDTFQTVVMILGSLSITVIGFQNVGGMETLKTKYMAAIPKIRNNVTTCGIPKKDSFQVFLDPVDGDYPWPGLVLQSSLGCLWYWCCDQVIVQRSLGAKNLSHAKGGSIVAGYLKTLPLFFIVFPGMISRALFPDEVGCVDPDECSRICDNPVGCSNIAYPTLVLKLLPVGLRGLLMAVMVSAIMSSLTSIFNSSSTVFTMDIWRRIRTQASQRELLLVGRLFVVLMCVISILWIPLVKSSQGGKLFQYMTAMEAYLGSPTGILFLLSMFWKGTTENGAFWGLVFGHVCGIIRLVLEFVYPQPNCGEEDTRPAFLTINYLYFGVIILVITAVATILISLVTKRRPEDELLGVTWWTKYKPDTEVKDSGIELTESLSNQENHDECRSTHQLEVDNKADHEFTPWYRRALDIACGSSEDQVTEIDIDHRKQFLHQTKCAKQILNINAAILVMVVCFLSGYFN